MLLSVLNGTARVEGMHVRYYKNIHVIQCALPDLNYNRDVTTLYRNGLRKSDHA